MAEDFDGIVGASWVETATRDEKSTQSILVHFDYCNRQPIYRFHISVLTQSAPKVMVGHGLI